MQDWNDFIMMTGEVDYAQVLSKYWSWLLPPSMKPTMCTVFGDWFLTDNDGTIHHLDLLEGHVSHIAESRSHFENLLTNPSQVDSWFLPGFVISLKARGIMRSSGQCFGYRIHPILGGPIESSNLILMEFTLWQLICSQLHEQIKKLPVGTRIVGCDLTDQRLTLLTE